MRRVLSRARATSSRLATICMSRRFPIGPSTEACRSWVFLLNPHVHQGPNVDMVFLVKSQLGGYWRQWRRRLQRASQNNNVVLGTLQPGTSPHRRVKDVAPLASAYGVLDVARFCRTQSSAPCSRLGPPSQPSTPLEVKPKLGHMLGQRLVPSSRRPTRDGAACVQPHSVPPS